MLMSNEVGAKEPAAQEEHDAATVLQEEVSKRAATGRSALPRLVLTLVASAVLLVSLVVLTQMAPYAKLTPGPAQDVSSGVTGDAVQGGHSGAGVFMMVTVDVQRVSWLEYLMSKAPWSSAEIVPLSTDEAAAKFAAEEMDLSKQTAALLAEKYVFGELKSITADGVEIIDVEAASPAEKGGLRSGDIVVSLGSTPTLDVKTLVSEISGTQGAVSVVVRRAQNTLAFPVTPASGRIGVKVAEHYHGNPIVSINTPGVGGASAGLAMTLSFIDALSPGDLTGGRRIAVTGTIDTGGHVGAVRGLRYKAVGAKNEGAEVILAPAERAESDSGVPLSVVRVNSLEDALRYLCAHGATDDVCSRPAGQ
jgi:PDZ domain-containing protein